ncbi:hypothetical protein CMK18_23145 [Candidatus Poribacteria bacterium]|nr:hypothetical protein [Candidatus Poribacteria bacterium]
MDMSRLTLVQALVFTLFIVMAICGLWLGYIWQDGMLGPVETQDRIDETLKQWGPFAFLIDIFIFMPLTWWFTRKYVWREKIKGVLPGLLLDEKPIIPIAPPPPPMYPKFVPPIYDTPANEDWVWEEMTLRDQK